MIDLTNYEVKRLFKDEGFENGFDVLKVMNGAGAYDNPVGKFQYPESKAAPSWLLIQWYSRKCLVNDRKDTGNPYENDFERKNPVLYRCRYVAYQSDV